MDYAVIFDMDGVLVDSYRDHYESWQTFCHERGLAMSEEYFAATFGRTSREVIVDLWGQDRFTPEEIAEIDRRKESIFRNRLANHFPVMDGARELIDALKVAGIAIGVGSSAPPENVWFSLDRIERRDSFSSVVTGADVTRGKPDPQVFLLNSQRLGVPPERCLVIEDAPPGIEAALAAGMTCVGFASTGRRPEQLTAAHQVIRSLRELTPDSLVGLMNEQRNRAR